MQTQYEREMASMKQEIELHEALQRLENNPDFIKLIKEEFLVQHAASLAQMCAYPEVVRDSSLNTTVMNDLRSISCFVSYLNAIHQRGYNAKNQVLAMEKAHEEELLEEQGAE